MNLNPNPTPLADCTVAIPACVGILASAAADDFANRFTGNAVELTVLPGKRFRVTAGGRHLAALAEGKLVKVTGEVLPEKPGSLLLPAKVWRRAAESAAKKPGAAVRVEVVEGRVLLDAVEVVPLVGRALPVDEMLRTVASGKRAPAGTVFSVEPKLLALASRVVGGVVDAEFATVTLGPGTVLLKAAADSVSVAVAVCRAPVDVEEPDADYQTPEGDATVGEDGEAA